MASDRPVGVLAGAAVEFAFAFAVFAASTAPACASPGVKGPEGAPRNSAVYVAMRDGVRIAVDTWLPEHYDGKSTLPAIVESTRYWRAPRKHNQLDPAGQALNEHGYAYVLVDARGSGASFGFRRMEWAPEEVADMRELVDWVVHQPWSNGRVGGMGSSYSGNTAELLAASGHPAVKAVAPLYSDFDAGSFRPGGVKVSGFLSKWFALNAALDANDICGLSRLAGVPCLLGKWFNGGVKPVDGAQGETLLTEAVAEHRRNIDLAKAMGNAPFAGDTTDDGLSIEGVSPFSYRSAIEASQVPMLIRVGWFDGATVVGALGRFNTFSNTQKLMVGAFSHGGLTDTDPFRPTNATVDPDPAQQMNEVVRFFDCYLKEQRPDASDPLCSPGKSLTYFTLGARTWKSTLQWPPPQTTMRRFYMAPFHALAAEPDAAAGSDSYRVDFAASTGKSGRWATQLGGAAVAYRHRGRQDARLLTYTSGPFPDDIEVTGQPVVSVQMSSDQPDGVVHAYLEDVAPDGEVNYLTEGVLRLGLRATAQTTPYWQAAPYHALRRADFVAMPPGSAVDVSFALFPISVRISAGHRIRVAIAGADADFYERIPASGDETFVVSTGPNAQSFLDLPVAGLTNLDADYGGKRRSDGSESGRSATSLPVMRR